MAGERNLFLFSTVLVLAIFTLTSQSQSKVYQNNLKPDNKDYILPEKSLFISLSQPTKQARSSTPLTLCELTNGTIWEEWRDCIHALHRADGNFSFELYLEKTYSILSPSKLPWGPSSPYSAVLLEFRCETPDHSHDLNRSIHNSLKNLPVIW